MIVVVLLLVVVVAGLVVAGLAAAGALGRTGPSGGRAWAAWLLPVGAAAGVAVLAGAGVVGVDVGTGPGDDGASPATTTATEADPAGAKAPNAPEDSPPPAEIRGPGPELPVVTVAAAPVDELWPYDVVDGLAPQAVLRVQASGFEPFEEGLAQQCVVELGRTTACAAAAPVRFDAEGGADFQVLVTDDVAPGGCRVGQPTCLLRVAGTDSERQAAVQTVFVDGFSPGRVTVEPASGLSAGDTAEVTVTGLPAGRPVTVALCASPGVYDARRCTSLPGGAFSVDTTGSGAATVTLGDPRVGADRLRCGPGRPCAVSVVVGEGFTAAPPVSVRISAGPGAAYDPVRLASGLAVAALLAAVAVVLAVRTDWSRPGEASTPALDAADLQVGSSLDELFGTDDELDRRDPLPSV